MTPEALLQRTRSLDSSVLSDVHPRWFPMAFPGLPDETIRHLIKEERFAGRLTALVRRRFDLATCHDITAVTSDFRLALLKPSALAQLPRLFGCIWHGHGIKHIIAGTVLARLTAVIGNEGHLVALANLDLAVAPDSPMEIGALLDAIAQDGQAAFIAWLDTLPRALAGRLRVALPPESSSFTETHRAAAPGLARRLAEACMAGNADA